MVYSSERNKSKIKKNIGTTYLKWIVVLFGDIAQLVRAHES